MSFDDLMRQQHAFSLSNRFFPTSSLRIPLFPDKAGCCLGLFRSIHYSFKTKAKVGITSRRTPKNLPPCPPWSTNLPQLWPNDAPNEVRTNDMWGQTTSGRPLSASVVLKKKKETVVVFFTMECGGGKTPGELPSVRNERGVRGEKRENSSSTSSDSNVNVNLESAWFGTSKGLTLLQSRDCTTERLVRYQ